MDVEMTPTYITTIRPDRTIALPPEMPVGATVAVIVVPARPSAPDEAARRTRFETTLAAIRASMHATPPPVPPDGELDALIERARKNKPL